MDERRVGNTQTMVGAIGLGCMGMSWGYAESSRDDAASTKVIQRAVDAGITFIDTADIYGDGHNEILLGGALRGLHDGVFLATKGGLVVDDLVTKQLHRDGSPAHIRTALDRSLARLEVQAVDLYYLHRTDEDVPIEETWGAMIEAVHAGKARHLGLSEVTVEQAEQLHALHPVTAIQSELSLWTPDPLTNGLVDWCAVNNVSFVPFAPLGRGFLTGQIDSSTKFDATDIRAHNPRFAAEARADNQAIVDVVREIATRRSATPAQIAIAWTLAQGEHVIPIPGTRDLTHLQQNIDAVDVTLQDADLLALNSVPTTAGSRY